MWEQKILSGQDRTHTSPCCCCCCCCCSVAESCPTLCDPMDYSTPGPPVLHHLPELAQTAVHWVGDVIQPSHALVRVICYVLPYFFNHPRIPLTHFWNTSWNNRVMLGLRQRTLPSGAHSQYPPTNCSRAFATLVEEAGASWPDFHMDSRSWCLSGNIGLLLEGSKLQQIRHECGSRQTEGCHLLGKCGQVSYFTF